MADNIFDKDIKFSIDTSTLTSTNLNDDEFKENIYANLQSILKNVFNDCYERQHIKKTNSGFNFACPFCRDSSYDNKKKRGNIILKGDYAGRFKCHNCGKTMKLPWFFKAFDISMTLSELNYYTNNVVTQSIDSSISNQMSRNVLDVDTAYQWAIPRDYIKQVLNVVDVTKEGTPMIWNYLIGRCQYHNFERFLYSPQFNQLLILNLVKDRVLGLQLRNLNKNDGKPKYTTLTIEKMRNLLMRDSTPIPQSISQLSCVFNIFNVDFVGNMPVLVTEGPFDAFLLPNCIAISGASKNFQMQYPFWYVYDNDATGKKETMEKLNKGYKVFMWKKFMSEYGLPSVNPYETKNKYKWDVTDVMKYLRDYKVTKQLFWSPYFTNSALDGLNI